MCKCNKKRIADSPNLSINYYSIVKLTSTEIIPKGTPLDLGQPHDRARLAA